MHKYFHIWKLKYTSFNYSANKSLTNYFVLLTGLFFLNSCNRKMVIKFKPVIGSKYMYTYEQVDSVVQQIGKVGNQIIVEAKNRCIFTYKIEKQSSEEYVASVQFISCEIENISDGSTKGEYPTRDSTFFHKELSNISGTIFFLRLSPSGNIIDMNGFQDYLKKFQTNAEQQMSEDYFRSIFMKISEVLPNEGVEVGSSWKSQIGVKDQIEFIDETNTLSKVEQNLAYIKSSSFVKQRLPLNGDWVVCTGMAHSEIRLESNTGTLEMSKTTINVGGIFKIGALDLSQNLVRTTILHGEKIGRGSNYR